MSQFTHKYVHSRRQILFDLLLQAAIRFRGAVAALAQIFQFPKRKPPSSHCPIFLAGDKKTAQLIRPLLLLQGKMIVEEKKDAAEIIYCEGPEFSFKEIIHSFGQVSTVTRYKIHSAGSSSIIASPWKDKTGEAIFIPNF